MNCACACDFEPLQGNALNLAKEDMSIAFISAVVAQSGLQTNHPYKHDDGIDIEIAAEPAVVPGVNRRNPRLFVQMKATSHPEIDDNVLTFRFKKRTSYEKLSSLSTIPQALILYVMPDERQKWMVPAESRTDVNGHAFFINMADVPSLGQEDAPKVEIPIANRVTSSSLIEFFCDAIRRHYTPEGGGNGHD